MTVQDVINSLQADSTVLEAKQAGDPQQTAFPNIESVTVKYLRLNGDIIHDMQTILYVEDFGGAGETAYFKSGKPSVLSITSRSPYLDKQQYKTELETQYSGWEVLKLKIRIDEDLDVLDVKASDGTNVKDVRVTVWKDENDNLKHQLVE